MSQDAQGSNKIGGKSSSKYLGEGGGGGGARRPGGEARGHGVRRAGKARLGRAGGTFALYSLIWRHANVSLLPNRQVADELSTYKLECPPEVTKKATSLALRSGLRSTRTNRVQTALLIMVMIGTCMVVGDGILTPAISVFSAVSGLELSLSRDQHE